jgi:hypothetical protein
MKPHSCPSVAVATPVECMDPRSVRLTLLESSGGRRWFKARLRSRMIWADHDAVRVADERTDVLACAQSDWLHGPLSRPKVFIALAELFEHWFLAYCSRYQGTGARDVRWKEGGQNTTSKVGPSFEETGYVF